MSDDLAAVFGPMGFGVGAGMGAMALILAANESHWVGFAIASAIALLVGLGCLAWSTR